MILLVGIGFYFYGREEEEEVKVEPTKIEKKKVITKEEELISVDIKGEVITPGMYSVKPNMRILDVINQAGGLTENADTTVINLSKKVQDEMVIIIYSKEQVKNFEETKKVEEIIQEQCKNSENNTIENDACIGSIITSTKININTATKEELMTLNKIGESKAQDIISYREKNGLFKSIEEIKNVSGIGESIYAQIKENITV